MIYQWIGSNFTWQEGQMEYWFLGLAALCMVIPYLLGSINPAIIISRLFYKDDIRQHGSGNAGSTNMLRTFGAKAAVFTFVSDMLKTVLSVLLGWLLIGGYGMSIAGFFAGFGHMFPIYYKFKGGKGVACYATVALMISPLTFLCVVGVFIIVLIGSKMVSMASVMAALLYPLFMNAFAAGFPLAPAMAVVEACFVVFMHRENLKRIWHYEERKVDFSKLKLKKKKKTSPAESTEEAINGDADGKPEQPRDEEPKNGGNGNA